MLHRVLSIHKWGGPKLKRPKELKGLKKAFSVGDRRLRLDWYLLPGGVAIVYCNNFFSKSYSPPPEFGPCYSMNEKIDAFNKQYPRLAIKARNKKFAYEDCFGEIILRNEAWLKFSGLPEQFRFLELNAEIQNVFFAYHGELCNDPAGWRRVLSDAVARLKNNRPL